MFFFNFQTIHENHLDKKVKLGAKFYNDVRSSHPRTTQSALPKPLDEDLVVNPGLYRALEKNRGEIMKHRQDITDVMEIMTSCNQLEMWEICTFFQRLKCSCDKQASDALYCLKFFARFQMRDNFMEYHQYLKPQIDECLAKAEYHNIFIHIYIYIYIYICQF